MQTQAENETMNTVLAEILVNLGVESVESMELGEAYKIDMSDTTFMDLHVEKVRPNRLSIAHYVKQNGDLCRDPEIVFKQVGEGFVPVELQQDTVFKPHYKHDQDGLSGIDDLLERWGENLREQGHVEAAKTAEQLGGC